MELQIDPHASLKTWIELPTKHKLSQEKMLFEPLTNQKKNQNYIELSQPLLIKSNALLDELNQTFQVYDDPKQFRFSFPDSMFPEVPRGHINEIRYQQKIIHEEENTFKNRLSAEQLKQIEESGQFKVKSNIDYITLPYVWQINNVVFWGKKSLNQAWIKSLANVYGLFWEAKNLIIQEIPSELMKLTKIPKSLLRLFFGARSIQSVVRVDYNAEIYKDFWNKIMKNNYNQSEQWFHALWSYLYVYYDPELSRPIETTDDKQQNKRRQQQREKLRKQYQADTDAVFKKKQVILDQHYKFLNQWKKMSKKVIIDITEQVNGTNARDQSRAESQEQLLVRPQTEDKDQKILQKIAERKFTLYTQHLQKNLPSADVPVGVINAIVLILRLWSVISQKQEKMNTQKNKKRQQITQRIKKQHTIKSKYLKYLNRRVNKQMQKVNKALEDQFYQTIMQCDEIASQLNNNQKQAYKQFLRVKYNMDSLIQAKKKQKPQYHAPTRTFYSNYRLLPPYQVIKTDNNYYTLKKVSDDLTVDTRQNFWKLKLYWMRVKTWTINCVVVLVFSVWKGPVGLRNLWGMQNYNQNMNINYQTGQIYYGTRSTVLGTFKKVLSGINKSRQSFQQTPDLGLLGKNVSRIFNYLECYVFRFLLVGVILVLICYPILILVASSVIFVLICTFWAWMPVILIATYLFNVFIKQYQSAHISHGFSARIFPFFRVFLVLLIGPILISLLFVLNLILLAPIITIFIMGYSILTQVFRRTLDKIMMFIFTNLGRTPSRNTLIAKKISGPGMSKNFYMSINEEDVYVLIRANLEAILMSKLNSLMVEQLKKDQNKLRNIINKVLSPFSAYFNKKDQVFNNVSILINNYNDQYSIYMNRYPKNPKKVRFTQQQINNYFPNTVSIVKNYVNKNQIHGWIFEQFQLYQGMYEELTRCLWIRTFNCGQEIFEPLEKLDTRFKLEDQYKKDGNFNVKMKKNVGSVMKALEGQVQLNHHHQRLAPFKRNLLSKQKKIQRITDVFEIWSLNKQLQVNLTLYDVRTLFTPNLNIKQLTIVQDEQRIRNIKSHANLVDL